MKRGYIFLFPAILLLSFASCTGPKEGGDQPGNDTTRTSDELNSSTEEKYDYVISNIPIPFEILDRLFKSGVSYSSRLTDPVSNESKYLQNNSKALNLGIYGADMTYTICFEKFSELGPFLKNSKKLADDLGIPLAFNKETLDKYETYKSNKDSLRDAVYHSYNEVDRTLKSNERISLAALVVTGGWVEGLYITCNTTADSTLKPETRKELFRIVRKQSFHLDNIVNLLNEFKNDPYFQQLISDLQSIQQVYASVSRKSEVNEEETAQILEKVSMLRKKITDGM